MDEDALTITTALILALFVIEIMRGSIKINQAGKFVVLCIVLFLLANTLSLLQLRGYELLTHIRPYLGMITAIFLFYLTINMIKTTQEFTNLLIIIYVFLIIQLGISLLIIAGYDMSFLSIFATRQHEFWTTTHRAAGLIHDYELLAEWYAVFIPFTLWLLFTKQLKWLQILGIVALIVGIVITATRGAFLSLGVGILVFLIMVPGKTLWQRAKLFTFTLVVIVISWIVIGFVAKDIRSHFVQRFDAAVTSYQEGSSVTEVMNRKEIWDNYLNKYLIFALIGTGQSHAEMGHLHSLYFTLLYQNGLLGLLSFCGLLVTLIVALIRKYLQRLPLKRKLLLALALSSLMVFIVDEIKIEFTRTTYCMQYVWLMLGLVRLSTILDHNFDTE